MAVGDDRDVNPFTHIRGLWSEYAVTSEISIVNDRDCELCCHSGRQIYSTSSHQVPIFVASPRAGYELLAYNETIGFRTSENCVSDTRAGEAMASSKASLYTGPYLYRALRLL